MAELMLLSLCSWWILVDFGFVSVITVCCCTNMPLHSIIVLCLTYLSNSLSLIFFMTLFFFHSGQRWSPGGISHEKKTGLSTEGVSDRGQGRYRQFQHPSSAQGYSPGSSEEPAAGTTPRHCVPLHMESSNQESEGRGGGITRKLYQSQREIERENSGLVTAPLTGQTHSQNNAWPVEVWRDSGVPACYNRRK